MSKFKVGDRVRCTHAAAPKFTFGKIYTVMVDGDRLEVSDNSGGQTIVIFSSFELVTDTPRPDPVEWLKAELQRLTDEAPEFMHSGMLMPMIRMLRECYGVEATAAMRTEWAFSPVSP